MPQQRIGPHCCGRWPRHIQAPFWAIERFLWWRFDGAIRESRAECSLFVSKETLLPAGCVTRTQRLKAAAARVGGFRRDAIRRTRGSFNMLVHKTRPFWLYTRFHSFSAYTLCKDVNVISCKHNANWARTSSTKVKSKRYRPRRTA